MANKQSKMVKTKAQRCTSTRNSCEGVDDDSGGPQKHGCIILIWCLPMTIEIKVLIGLSNYNEEESKKGRKRLLCNGANFEEGRKTICLKFKN